jgi:DNA-binding MarR family transcriptional regulator
MISTESPTLGDQARVLNAFRAIVRAARTSTRALEMRFGTSAAQLFMLRALSGGDVGSVKELAQRTNTHNSSASVVVRRLCERGFVRRTASIDDRRRVGYSITAEGLAYLGSAPRAIDDLLLEGAVAMSPAEQRRLAELLTRLVIHSSIPMCDSHTPAYDDEIVQHRAHAVDAAD